MNRQQRDFTFQLKAVDEAGTFEGIAAVFGNVDLGGDVIEPGAFTKTLQERGYKFPLLWQHDQREPIGSVHVAEGRKGLEVRGKLTLGSPVAQKAHALLLDGVLRGLSIGYDAVQDEIRHGVRFLKQIRLWEVSIVTFPMNPLAQVTHAKAEDQRTVEVLRDLKQFLGQFDFSPRGR